ncbi:type II CRISPR-associated endonuclease Cas1 [Eggerthellaceae bacterium zg-997]|nr:type II CRISPR-associated endonuclease Cas1 [Eggerthellaceae bacterium zg-997]
MPKRTVYIQSACKLALRHRALVVCSDKGPCELPLEDIMLIVVESHQATLTSPLLAALSEHGIALVVCDNTHMPCSIQLPLHAHWQHTKIAERQLGISKPLRKQLWARIVQQKLVNQARCLELLEIPGSDLIRAWAKEIHSGDSTNREAVGASLYFQKLLPLGGRRNSDFSPSLDFGYSIVRSAIARCIVASGWLPFRGIHHCSMQNPFNLADDLIEPFRPCIDLLVMKNRDELPAGDNSIDRKAIYRALEYEVLLSGKLYSIQSAIQRTIDTLSIAVETRCAGALELPALIDLKIAETERG